MIRRVVIVVACIFLVQARASAASLGDIKRISPAGNGEDVSQIWVAADPTDSRYLVVCGGDSYPRQNVSTGYVYSTGDGGATWHQTMFERATKFISEESCTYSKSGRAYFAAGESDTSMGEPRHEWGHLHIFSSDDHGLTWKSLWKRKNGWMDWTSMAAVPAIGSRPSSLVVFANSGTDRLGHWWQLRPVAIVSHDNGRTFSELLAPGQPAGLHYVAVWTSGSAVLPDGTALFSTTAALAPPKAKITGWANTGHLWVNVFAYSSSTGKVTSRAVIRKITDPHSVIFTVAMAHDTGHDRFAGRLYTAWNEYNGIDHTAVLWLATSDDGGYHWSARPVSTRGCLGNLQLAVAPNGTLGLVWTEADSRVDSAFSRDGGHTFIQKVVAVQHGPGAYQTTDAVSFDESWYGESLAVDAGKSAMNFGDFDHPGLSIRMAQPRGIDDYGIVADASGLFHALWSQAEPDGTHALFTRTIRVSPQTSPGSSLLASGAAQCSGGGTGHRSWPPVGRMPSFQLAGQQDITDSLIMRIQNLQYDRTSETLSADITLTNKGKTVISGPLTFVSLGLHSDFGPVVPANATGALQGQPFWDASSIVPAQGLQPGATSAPLTVRFKLTRFTPVPDGETGGDGASMWVRIFEKAPR